MINSFIFSGELCAVGMKLSFSLSGSNIFHTLHLGLNDFTNIGLVN